MESDDRDQAGARARLLTERDRLEALARSIDPERLEAEPTARTNVGS